MSTPTDKLIKDMLDEAAGAINSGDIPRGEQNLRKILSTDPTNVLALLWMTKCTQDPFERAHLFDEVLKYDPANPHALKGRDTYRKYLRVTSQSAPEPSPPDLSPPAAKFEPPPPSSLGLISKRIRIAIAGFAILLIAGVGLALRPTLKSLFSKDPVDSLRDKLYTMSSHPACANVNNLEYDVRQTNSLVSPYIATISGVRNNEMHFEITLAYQDDQWIPKSASGYWAFDMNPITDSIGDALMGCLE